MPEAQPRKRLYRSKDDRVIAGVCGGLAEYFNVETTWVRILFIVLLIAALSTLVVYLILWVIVPEAPIQPPQQNEPPSPE